jgi:cell division protein DivIC
MAARRAAARRRVAVSRLVLRRALVVAAVVFVAFMYYRPLRTYVDTKRELRARASDVRALRAQKRRLQRQLHTAGTAQELARQARMQLSLVKPGEHLFIVKGIDAWRRAQRAAR